MAQALPAVICQALDAFRAALDGLGVKHSIQPAGSYTTLTKSRDVLLRELRRAQDACGRGAHDIRHDLLLKKHRAAPLAPLVVVTAEYRPPPTIEQTIARAHAHENVRAMGEWITSAVLSHEDLADVAMGERFAEEALRMSVVAGSRDG
jgi:hypothetical protein